jgi:hypothetical protein
VPALEALSPARAEVAARVGGRATTCLEQAIAPALELPLVAGAGGR